MTAPVIHIKDLVTRFGTQVIHDRLSLDVERGEILGIVGGSGSGKTVLLNTILGLNHPASGEVQVFGKSINDRTDIRAVEQRWGVLFQSGALFSSLTVGENIAIPMVELAQMPRKMIGEMISLKLHMVGLPAETACKYPEELSGGMIKRVSLARALAIDAELLFLDEPTAGLDPIAATAFDNLIKTLSKALDLTVVMITHDLDSLHAVCTRIAVLVDKKILSGTIQTLVKNPNPWIQDYFRGERGRAALRT